MFDSYGKPAALAAVSDSCVPGGSGTEFEVGRIASCEEDADATMKAPLHHESIMGQFRFCITQDMSPFTSLLSFRSSWGPSSKFWRGAGDEEAETIKERQVISPFSPLAPHASASNDFSSREHSLTIMEQVLLLILQFLQCLDFS